MEKKSTSFIISHLLLLQKAKWQENILKLRHGFSPCNEGGDENDGPAFIHYEKWSEFFLQNQTNIRLYENIKDTSVHLSKEG